MPSWGRERQRCESEFLTRSVSENTHAHKVLLFPKTKLGSLHKDFYCHCPSLTQSYCCKQTSALQLNLPYPTKDDFFLCFYVVQGKMTSL